jgi:hypothetical protein
MVRNQKIHIDANPAVACIRRDRPSGHEHPRGPADPDPDPDPVRSSLRAFAMDVIANIRTDLDAFSEVEQAVLMNTGTRSSMLRFGRMRRK